MAIFADKHRSPDLFLNNYNFTLKSETHPKQTFLHRGSAPDVHDFHFFTLGCEYQGKRALGCRLVLPLISRTKLDAFFFS